MAKATIGHNQPPVTSLTDEECRDLALIAFNENVQGDTLKGTAVQRMAAVVMGHHGNMSNVFPLADVIDPNMTKKRADMKAEIVKLLLGELIDEPKRAPDRKQNAKLAEYTAQRNRVALINDGLDLAGILAKHNVTLASYNRDTGQWTVPSKLLVKDGWVFDSDFATVPLDGTSWYTHLPAHEVDGKKVDVEYGKTFSSFRQLKSIHKPPVSRSTGGETGTGAGAGGSPSSAGKPVDTIRDLCERAIKLLRARDTDGKTRLFRALCQLEEPDRKALTNLAIEYDAMRGMDEVVKAELKANAAKMAA